MQGVIESYSEGKRKEYGANPNHPSPSLVIMNDTILLKRLLHTYNVHDFLKAEGWEEISTMCVSVSEVPMEILDPP
jgi:hypothetical protein